MDEVSQNELKINSGMPPGSVLSHTLLLIFGNDILSLLVSRKQQSLICVQFMIQYFRTLENIQVGNDLKHIAKAFVFKLLKYLLHFNEFD